MYNHKEIEAKWQAYWEKNKTFKVRNDFTKPKYYTLDMFPYPSGAGLHVWHPEWMTANDIVARYKNACGYNVLHPMWWDAFWLPAENYAIKTGTHPRITTDANIKTFKSQIKKLGFSYDWDREIDTTDPKYYKWTQWIFLKLFEKGLAYEQDLPINYCPSCKTWLANEEVLNDFTCERCGTKVEKKKIRQWVLGITKYADRLLADVDKLDWPESIKEMQRNWIGKNNWVKYRLKVKNTDINIETYSTHFEAFYADTFAVIAADHTLLPEIVKWTENENKILEFAKKINNEKVWGWYKEITDHEWIFTWRYLEDPITWEDLPLWISSYALSDYGTWIIKCSAHDERDFNFAKKYNLPLRVVMFPTNWNEEELEKIRSFEYCYNNFKDSTLKYPKEFEWRNPIEAHDDIIYYLVDKWFAKKSTQYKLRDWLFSRQRYWWEPIPLIHISNSDFESLPRISDMSESMQENIAYIYDKKWTEKRCKNCDCNDVWCTKLIINGKSFSRVYDWVYGKIICDYRLPLELPNVADFEPAWDWNSPLAKVDSFVNIKLANNLNWKRETNTMPQWGWSCWYYLRYMDNENNDELVNKEIQKYWGQVDSYVGWAEHAVLHLLYARFWHKFLFDIWVVSRDEPFFRLRNQWLILAHAYQRKNGWLIPNDMVIEKDGKYYEIGTGDKVNWVEDSRESTLGWEVDKIVSKMSKSLKNVVNPDDIVEEFWADSLRLYEMYMAEFKDAAPWDSKGIIWVRRFLEKSERLFTSEAKISTEDDNATMKLVHKTIKKVQNDIENYKFNTAIASLMILVNNWLPKDIELQREWRKIFLVLLNPFAPHLAEELWERMNKEKVNSISLESWPKYDEAMTIDDFITIWVQVLGKLRWTIEINKDEEQESVLEKARKNEEVAKWLEWKEIVKEIYVPWKIVNIVVK